MYTLNCKGKLFCINQPIVMGILNINDDSFYKGSRFNTNQHLLEKAQQMISEGAGILDIGAQSTQPGSTPVSAQEELDRVLPAIQLIHQHFPEIIISIDTFYAEVAQQAVEAGASIINDISGGSLDSNLIETVATLNVPYVLTHIQGTPQTMQDNPQYNDVCLELLDYFIQKISFLKSKGINNIIIDPGFGFGKTASHNFTILKNLKLFEILKMPLMVGLSRKGMIYKTLETNAENALNGTTVLNTISLLNGANILRVHDVKEAIEAIKLTQIIFH